MTLIQPNKNNILLHKLIFLFAALLVAEALWLVTLYNRSVNLGHDIASMRAELKEIEARSAELKNKLFVALDTDELEAFARERNLIEDKKPQYFTSSEQWLASH
ncbi:hypothetical protein C4587_00130 [Candidatus Parcubacteria bacterium]|nr:MAG: hypothetical protein C4587_00130 [Candidatus Parcubacteria bacterium]